MGAYHVYKQTEFQKTHWRYRYSHGGQLRNSRQGRGARPLSSKTPIHVVLKANKCTLKSGFRTYKRYFLIHRLLDRYSKRFAIKVEQVTVQHDHLHLLIRASRRSHLQNFFRVFTGQIAQQLEQHQLLNVTDTPPPSPRPPTRSGISPALASPHRLPTSSSPLASAALRKQSPRKLWKHRPFTRVIKGWKAYKIVRNYIELNEQEVMGRVPYQRRRLRGLSSAEWELMWS